MSPIIENLKKFGLSEKEACVYSCLTTMGTSVVSAVAKRAELNRSTTYVILESLSKQGLVSISKRGKIQVFTPATPEKLIQIAEEKAKHYESLAELGKTLLTELKVADEQLEAKPKIQIFKGVESIKNVFEEILGSRTKNVMVYNKPFTGIQNDSFENMLIGFYSELHKKFNVTSLSDNTPENRKALLDSELEISNRSIMKTVTDFNSDLILFEGKIAFISRPEKTAYIIENGEFSNAIKNLFTVTQENSKIWNVKNAEKEDESKTKKREPSLVKAEKRFWKI